MLYYLATWVWRRGVQLGGGEGGSSVSGWLRCSLYLDEGRVKHQPPAV